MIYGYAPVFYGKVVDFFNVDFWDFTILGRTYERWPIFNIADASVTVGVLLLIIFHREPIGQKKKDEAGKTDEGKEFTIQPGTDEIPGGNSNEVFEENQLAQDGEDNKREEV
jgi:hypothetical protein